MKTNENNVKKRTRSIYRCNSKDATCVGPYKSRILLCGHVHIACWYYYCLSSYCYSISFPCWIFLSTFVSSQRAVRPAPSLLSPRPNSPKFFVKIKNGNFSKFRNQSSPHSQCHTYKRVPLLSERDYIVDTCPN